MSIRIKSMKNGHYMTAPDGVVDNGLIYCQSNKPPLEFEFQGTPGKCSFHVVNTQLFLSFRNLTGAVKLYDDPTDAYYELTKIETVYWIKNLAYKQYMWLDGNEPRVSGIGDPKTYVHSLWIIDGL